MIAFERFLLENGWKKYRNDYKKGMHVETDTHELSTIGNLYHLYMHPDHQDVKIVIGLREKGHGPTLMSHREHFGCDYIDEKTRKWYDCSDTDIERVFEKLSNEEILSTILNGQKHGKPRATINR